MRKNILFILFWLQALPACAAAGRELIKAVDLVERSAPADAAPALAEAEKIFKKLEGQRGVTAEEAALMQQAYLKAHLFGKARELALEYPLVNLPRVPGAIIETPGLAGNTGRYYETAPDGESAALKSLDLSKGNFILAYADPGSPAAAVLFKAIAADPEVGPAFAAWASLITDSYDFKNAAAWNQAHREKARIMYSRADWSALDGERKPVFNFLRDGKAVCYAAGEETGGTLAALKACLEKGGFLTPEVRLAAAARIVSLRVADRPGYRERLEIFKGEYLRLWVAGALESGALAAYSAPALSDAFETTALFTAYSPLKEKLGTLEAVFAELERRGLADPGRTETLYELFLDARKFGKAGALRARYPLLALKDLPEISGVAAAPGKKILYVPGGMSRLAAVAGDLKGKKIIVAAQPGCHPTQRAFNEIEKDKKLLSVFKKYGLLLAAGSDFSGAAAWNGTHAVKFKLINSAGDWPGVDFENSPAFYFLEDGKVVYSFVSWPGGGNLDELYKGFGRLGLF